jgi:hypothetical protein
LAAKGSDVGERSERSAAASDTNFLDRFSFIRDCEPTGAISESVLSDSNDLRRHFRSSESFPVFAAKAGSSVIRKKREPSLSRRSEKQYHARARPVKKLLIFPSSAPASTWRIRRCRKRGAI